MRPLLLAVVIAFAATGCTASPDDLRQYLADEWAFDPDYAAIESADITVDGGDVEVATDLSFEATQGQRLCEWVSAWVYDRGNGDDDSAVRVLNSNGDVLSQRQHENDVCSFG